MSEAPTHTMQQTVDRYFRAWELQDTDSLSEIFTLDAKYIVHPFEKEEYHGLEAIKGYWNDKPVSIQIAPKPRIITQAFGDACCFVEWETTFMTPHQTKKIVRGMMLLEFREERIAELREHYASTEL